MPPSRTSAQGEETNMHDQEKNRVREDGEPVSESPTWHPSLQELAAADDAEAPPALRDLVTDHVSQCADCRDYLEFAQALVRGDHDAEMGAIPAASLPELPPVRMLLVAGLPVMVQQNVDGVWHASCEAIGQGADASLEWEALLDLAEVVEEYCADLQTHASLSGKFGGNAQVHVAFMLGQGGISAWGQRFTSELRGRVLTAALETRRQVAAALAPVILLSAALSFRPPSRSRTRADNLALQAEDDAFVARVEVDRRRGVWLLVTPEGVPPVNSRVIVTIPGFRSVDIIEWCDEPIALEMRREGSTYELEMGTLSPSVTEEQARDALQMAFQGVLIATVADTATP